MRKPEDRSPQEWAEDFRYQADYWRIQGDTTDCITLDAADCDELAQRMDDLAEALRLLRDINACDSNWSPDDHAAADALLAKYEEGDDE